MFFVFQALTATTATTVRVTDATRVSVWATPTPEVATSVSATRGTPDHTASTTSMSATPIPVSMDSASTQGDHTRKFTFFPLQETFKLVLRV